MSATSFEFQNHILHLLMRVTEENIPCSNLLRCHSIHIPSTALIGLTLSSLLPVADVSISLLLPNICGKLSLAFLLWTHFKVVFLRNDLNSAESVFLFPPDDPKSIQGRWQGKAVGELTYGAGTNKPITIKITINLYWCNRNTSNLIPT